MKIYRATIKNKEAEYAVTVAKTIATDVHKLKNLTYQSQKCLSFWGLHP